MLRKLALILVASSAIMMSCKKENAKTDAAAISVEGDPITAELTAPPFVPKPVGDRPAKN